MSELLKESKEFTKFVLNTYKAMQGLSEDRIKEAFRMLLEDAKDMKYIKETEKD